MLFHKKKEPETIDATEAVDILINRLEYWSEELNTTLEYIKQNYTGSKTADGISE